MKYWILTGLMIANSVFAADSPQWLGINRNADFPETNLLKVWPQDGPKLLWSCEGVGSGYSSVATLGDRIYVTGNNIKGEKRKEFLTALNRKGKILYQTCYGNVTNKSFFDVRTTPTVVENDVFVISGAGEVAMLDADSGRLVWSVDAAGLAEGQPGQWGYAESPLVFDNKVLFTAGGKKASFVAFNIKDGSVAWQTPPLPGPAAYVSPILISQKGKKIIVGMTGKFIVGLDPATGKIIWKFEYTNEVIRGATLNGINAVTPIWKDGYLFTSTGYNVGSVMLKLESDLSKAELAWTNRDLDIHHGGTVVYDGVIYGANWVDNKKGNWVGVDWQTGKTLFERPWGQNKGSIALADGMLYCFSERGIVGLVKPAKDKFEAASSFTVKAGEGEFWAHPVISNQVLYIRHGDCLMAYDVKGE